MIKRIAPLLLAAAGFTCSALAPAQPASPTSQPAAKHDRDPWVFRCVLDGNARMVVVSLGNHYWAAFDAARCTLAKFWEGDVELVGAVYDMRHGPQPKANGRILLNRKWPTTAPIAEGSGMYRGYSLANDLVTFHYEANGTTIAETISLGATEPDGATLKRSFAIKGEAKSPVEVHVPLSDKVHAIRVVSGKVNVGGNAEALQAPADIPFEANADSLTVSATGDFAIETVFNAK